MTFFTTGAMVLTAWSIGVLVGITATTIAYYVFFDKFKDKLFEMCTVLDSTGMFGDHKTVKKE